MARGRTPPEAARHLRSKERTSKQRHPLRFNRAGSRADGHGRNSQARVSQIEHGTVTEVDAIRGCAESLGGTVDVVAHVGDWTVKVA